MEKALVVEKEPITLVGGAKFDKKLLKMALDRAPQSVGADGGGSALIADGQIPLAVIGDMDSIDPFMSAKIPADRFHPVAEQDSTDFEKCLMRVEAPALIGVGFLGARVDHQMAVQTVLVRYPHKRCLLLGEEDLIFVIPPEFSMALDPDVRVSIFPMAEGKIESAGLFWSTSGLTFAPDGQIGTSNKSTGPIRLIPDGPKMIAILPVAYFDTVFDALLNAPKWPPSRTQSLA